MTTLQGRRLIRLKELLTIVPLSRSTIYARMEAGTFPRAKDLGGGVVAWYEQDVLTWLDACPDQGSENNSGVAMGVAVNQAA